MAALGSSCSTATVLMATPAPSSVWRSCLEALTKPKLIQSRSGLSKPLKTSRALHKSTVESRDSGTTCVSLLVNDGVLYCSNVGDSRCVLGRRENNSIKATLSKDQTLYRQDERQRIEQCGGRILSIGQIEGSVPMDHVWSCDLGAEIDSDGDPPRLWRKDAYEPGTAHSVDL